MILYREFNYNIDMERVINSLKSYLSLPSPEEVNNTYRKLLEELNTLTNPMAVFNLKEKPVEYEFDFLNECREVFFCALTIGDNSSIKVERLFEEGRFLEAIMLDVMASILLFECTNQLENRILMEAGNRGLGITCRICPGDGEIPIEYQSDILSRIGDTKQHGIYITQGYLINPSKSMSFVYGAGEGIKLNPEENGCKSCLNRYCSMRKE